MNARTRALIMSVVTALTGCAQQAPTQETNGPTGPLGAQGGAGLNGSMAAEIPCDREGYDGLHTCDAVGPVTAVYVSNGIRSDTGGYEYIVETILSGPPRKTIGPEYECIGPVGRPGYVRVTALSEDGEVCSDCTEKLEAENDGCAQSIDFWRARLELAAHPSTTTFVELLRSRNRMKVYAAVQFLLGDEVGRPISKTQYDLDRIGASMTEVLADDLSMLHPSAFDRLLANRFPLSDWFGDVRCIAANANRNAIFVVLWTITSTLSNDGGAAWAIEPAWFEDVAALSLRYLDRDNGRFAPGTCPYGGKETVLACDLLNFAGYAADCKSMKWPETLPAEVRRSVHAQLDESAEGRKLTRQLAQMRLGTSESKEMLDELAQHIFVSSEHRSSQVALDWWPGAAELLFERLDSPDSNQRWSTCHVFRTMGLPLPCGAVRTTGLTPQERYSLHEAIDKASAH